jgi:hypothetical protein
VSVRVQIFRFATVVSRKFHLCDSIASGSDSQSVGRIGAAEGSTRRLTVVPDSQSRRCAEGELVWASSDGGHRKLGFDQARYCTMIKDVLYAVFGPGVEREGSMVARAAFVTLETASEEVSMNVWR